MSYPNWDDDYVERGKEYTGNSKTVKPEARKIDSLSEVNLDSELAQQYAEAISFRDWMIQNAESSNPKDVTDAIKTVNALISNIIKLQSEVNNLKNLKATEDAVIETMKQMPQEVRDVFFANLRRRLPQ